jgi:hypothetical protein
LDSTERAFLKQYGIRKLYCRYFDVVMNDSLGPMPNATITFSDSLPEGIEIIPTVFIMEDCMHQKPEGLAEKIVQRIVQMNETNDIKGVREIQIDCDYTAKSRKNYYDFLEELRSQLSTLNYHPSSPVVNEGTTCSLWCADALQYRTPDEVHGAQPYPRHP